MNYKNYNKTRHTYIARAGGFGRGASLYRHRSQLFRMSWVRLPLPIGQFSSSYNSRPIISSAYRATWNKRVRRLSVLKLWPIVQTLVMSENDGITVPQTVAHIIQWWPHELGTPCISRLSRGKAQGSVLCQSQAAEIVALAHRTQQ